MCYFALSRAFVSSFLGCVTVCDFGVCDFCLFYGFILGFWFFILG
jgi:hypothetical protein